MKTIKLEASKISKGNAKNIRKQDKIPAVIYGKGLDNKQISLDYQEFRKTFEKAGESTIIEIVIDNETIPVLVNDIQFNPVTDKFIHIDFHAVQMGKELHTNIPIHFEGEAPAVKLHGGIVVHGKESIEIKCLPRNLISAIKVDISSLTELKMSINVSDLNIPETITILDNPDTMIVNIAAPRIEEEKTTTEEGEEGETEEDEDNDDNKEEGDEKEDQKN